MDERLKQIQKLLDAAEGNLHSARNLMRDIVGGVSGQTINPEEKAKNLNIIEEGKIIEGVYNGDSMIGPDGKEYPVPANYASKSKLVEGDVLKLTIAEDGSFIFKQIKPIERRKTIGTLVYNDGSYTVNADGKSYKVLQASVTYYKGEPGDQVSIILPKDHESTWAAIENIVKKGAESTPNTPEISSTAEENQPEESAESETEVTPPAEDSETSEEQPVIEYPTNNDTLTTPTDEEILKNLEEKTVPVDQTEEPPQDVSASTSTEDEDDKDQGSQGIKELEI